VDKKRILSFLRGVDPAGAKKYGKEVGAQFQREVVQIVEAAKHHPEEACSVLLAIQGLHEALSKFGEVVGDNWILDRATAIAWVGKIMFLPADK